MHANPHQIRRFENKIALITGGASGIGRATANRLADEGAHAIIADLNAEMGNRAVSQIEEAGGEATFLHVDLSDDTSVRKAGQIVSETFPTLHMLVNNAAILRIGNIEDGEWRKNWEPETRIVRGWVLLTEVFLPLLKKQGGAIVNTSSEGGFLGRKNLLVYDAIKASLVSMTKTMAYEFVDYGIRVNAVAPGWIVTEMHFGDAPDPQARRKELAETPISSCIMGRRAPPEEVASVIAFLLSEDASYITAQTIHVDGGRMGMNLPKKK